MLKQGAAPEVSGLPAASGWKGPQTVRLHHAVFPPSCLSVDVLLALEIGFPEGAGVVET